MYKDIEHQDTDIRIRMSESDKEKIKKICRIQNTDMSKVMRLLIRNYIKKHEKFLTKNKGYK